MKQDIIRLLVTHEVSVSIRGWTSCPAHKNLDH